MKQIHQVEWKFGTQNLVATCTLTLKQTLEHFPKSILGKLYIFRSLEVRNPTLQTICKSELKRRSYGCLKIIVQSWRTISKSFQNSTYEFKIQFEMTPISNSHAATLIFHLFCFENCILGTLATLSGPHTTRNHDYIIFLVILGNYI